MNRKRSLILILILLTSLFPLIPIPIAKASSITVSISNDYDDVWMTESGNVFSSVFMVMILDNEIGIHSFLRFQNLQISKTAKINYATLKVYVAESQETPDPGSQVTIYGIDEPDCAPFSVGSGLWSLSRPYTSANVNWNTTVWAGYQSVNVTDIVKEIVNQYAWSSGNDLGLQILGGSDSGQYPRSFEDYYHMYHEGQAELTIVYDVIEEEDEPPVEDPVFVEQYGEYTIWLINGSLGYNGWAFRKSHNITGSTVGELTDYQVNLTLRYSQGWENSEKQGFMGQTIGTEFALYESGQILWPYQTGDPNDQIRLKIYNSTTFEELQDYLVGTDPIPDDGHGQPAIIKYGSYYVIIYGQHGATGSLKVSYTLDLENYTTYAFPIVDWHTYPQTFIWDEDLYLFIRDSVSGTQTQWKLYHCSDITDSGTWTLNDTIVNEGATFWPYAISRVIDDGEGGDRLLLVWGRRIDGGASYGYDLMCAYSDDLTNWYDADGDPIEIPLNKANSFLMTLDHKLGFGRAEGYGDTFWILPRWSDVPNPGNVTLIKKVIGGALSTYDFGINGIGGELFYHPVDGSLTLYLNMNVSGNWGVRRYKILDSTITHEQTYGIRGTERPRMIRRIYDEDDWVIASLITGVWGSPVNPILICTDENEVESPGDVNLNANCRTDFGDIRFTKSDGVTNLDYWIETKTDGSVANVWVKIDTIPVSPNNVTIYVVYGKADAITTSNHTATMIRADDGVSGSFDEATAGTATFSYVDGLYKITENSNDDAFVSGVNMTDLGWMAYIRVFEECVGGGGAQVDMSAFALYNESIASDLIGTGPDVGDKYRFQIYRYSSNTAVHGNKIVVAYKNQTGDSKWWDGAQWLESATRFETEGDLELRMWANGTFIFGDVFYLGSSIFESTPQIEISSVGNFTEGKLLAWTEPTTDNKYITQSIDRYFIRKHVSIEPTFSGYGTQENETDNVYIVTDENGTVIPSWNGENCTSLDCIEDWIDDNLLNGGDPLDPDPGTQGWDTEGPFTRFKMRLYILFIGLGCLFTPLWAMAYKKFDTVGYTWCFLIMVLGVGLLWSITGI